MLSILCGPNLPSCMLVPMSSQTRTRHPSRDYPTVPNHPPTDPEQQRKQNIRTKCESTCASIASHQSSKSFFASLCLDISNKNKTPSDQKVEQSGLHAAGRTSREKLGYAEVTGIIQHMLVGDVERAPGACRARREVMLSANMAEASMPTFICGSTCSGCAPEPVRPLRCRSRSS